MISLEVRNFQSIEHEKICIDGFTALVGRSNIGKSALVRAVKSALTGAVGTAFVRHGAGCLRRVKSVRSSKTCECFCSVHLITDGFDLLWEKGDKRNRYVFNGKEYGVPNRGTPEFLQRPTLSADFGMVEIGQQSKLLQIADQFVDTIFLLDQSGGVTADVFSDVARLDRVNVAIRLAEKDRKDSVSTRKVRDTDILSYVRQLEAYANLDRDVMGVGTAEIGLSEVGNAEGRVLSLDRYISDLKDIGYRVDQLEMACRTVTPDLKPMTDKMRRYATIAHFSQATTERASAVKRLMGVETVSEPVVDSLIEASKRHVMLTGWVVRLQVLQEFFTRFKGLAEVLVPEYEPLRELHIRAYDSIRLAGEYEKLTKTIDRLEREQVSVETDEQKILVERETLSGFFCPTCEQPMMGHQQHDERETDAELRLPN